MRHDPGEEEDSMKFSKVSLLMASATLGACVSIPRDEGLNDLQVAVSRRAGAAVEWNAQPVTTDHRSVAAMLRDDLTADEAVAIALLNNPRLQVTLAELGIARAD